MELFDFWASVDPEGRVEALIFWSQVDRSGGPNACWLWTGTASRSTGYGVLWNPETQKQVRAHRTAWILTHGDPGSALVRHVCPEGSERLCCNPAHLTTGTHLDNAADTIAEGRNKFNAEMREFHKRQLACSAAG